MPFLSHLGMLLAAAVATLGAPIAADEAHADESVWRDQQGKPSPESEFRKSKNGFGGLLMVTPDMDWKAKWETSPETVPNFRTADMVNRGDRLAVLTFFSGPGVDEKNNVNVTCDIQCIRPDGSFSADGHDIPVLTGELHGNRNLVRLSPAVIDFVGEANDPAGKWTIRVLLKDKQRHIELSLTTFFTLK